MLDKGDIDSKTVIDSMEKFANERIKELDKLEERMDKLEQAKALIPI